MRGKIKVDRYRRLHAPERNVRQRLGHIFVKNDYVSPERSGQQENVMNAHGDSPKLNSRGGLIQDFISILAAALTIKIGIRLVWFKYILCILFKDFKSIDILKTVVQSQFPRHVECHDKNGVIANI